MPYKVCREDYEDYEDYDDYDYDYEYDDVEEDVESLESKQEPAKTGVWSCSICTYDNDESMSVCDICGVLRVPLLNNASNNNNGTAPFKFDVPSPDDLVSNGLQSSRMGSKVADLKLSRVSSSTKKPSNANALLPKDKQARMDESHSLKNEVVQASSKSSDSSSSVMPKDRHDTVDDSIGSSIDGAEPLSHTDNLTSNLKNVSLNVKSGNSTHVSDRRENSHRRYKPERWMLPDKAGDGLTQLNLAIVGHVDAGKSTLSGRLLYLLGRISKKQMHKYEKEAKLQGKGSFAYAWAMDESSEERERGITMTVAVAFFDSKNYHVVVLDSPGHRDFVPNLISGATQSDAAILVIDASAGAFEVGMDTTKGQTREHAQLVRSFGVDQLIVAVNKMDAVQYSKERFDSIKLRLGTFLRSCGFKDSSVTWIPLSAMENQNLVTAPDDAKLLSWYQGPCLLDAIDSLQSPTRDFSKPLLMPICDVVKLQHGHVSACGKLEAGALRSGLKVLVMPSGEVGTVHHIECNSQPCAIARAGDNIAVSLQGIDVSQVISGGVICHPDFPVAIATHFELKILVLDFVPPILIGSQLECHVHHAKEAARIVKILSLLDTKTGKVAKKSPRCLTAKQSAVVEVVLQAPVCVEEFSNCRALGRVFLRSLGRTIAVGIVTRIIGDQQ
ncbi:putative Elongation factor 1-alpha [Melia azedarach]|uniref:Elongation factor 1-alpha n=1 Tax=Melia azedarach TaxID=155640 RepID=A0ACC1X949_MELAZ|nr:putative Elongation factor 1-alpha [Melia azedarach]